MQVGKLNHKDESTVEDIMGGSTWTWKIGSIIQHSNGHSLCNFTATYATQINISGSEASGNFVCNAGDNSEVYPVENLIIVGLPNNQKMQATHQGVLNVPGFPTEAKTCHIFPQMKNNIFLSIGQFCYSGYDATFSKHKMTIQNYSIVYIMGKIVR